MPSAVVSHRPAIGCVASSSRIARAKICSYVEFRQRSAVAGSKRWKITVGVVSVGVRDLAIRTVGWQSCRREDCPFAHARQAAAPDRCGELRGIRASTAAAVRCRGKASGRRVMRRFPTVAPRPFSAVCASFPAVAA